MKPAVLASVRIVPLGTQTSSIGKPVDEAISVLKKSGATCKTNPTCTEMYGQWETISTAISSAIDTLLRHEEINRVMCDVHIDVKRFSRQSLPTYSQRICEE